jgi:hypothetical protein
MSSKDSLDGYISMLSLLVRDFYLLSMLQKLIISSENRGPRNFHQYN